MPLCCQVKRNGEAIPIRWSFGLYCTMIRALKDQGYQNTNSEFEMIFKEDITFRDEMDPQDPYTIEIKAGDIFHHWHGH